MCGVISGISDAQVEIDISGIAYVAHTVAEVVVGLTNRVPKPSCRTFADLLFTRSARLTGFDLFSTRSHKTQHETGNQPTSSQHGFPLNDVPHS